MESHHPGWKVVGEARDGREAISKTLETAPDVTVLDYSMPVVNGLEATRQILNHLPKTEVLIFTMHNSEALVDQLLSAGARGYVLKTDARRDLITAIESLALHRPFLSRDLINPDLGLPFSERPRLTNRERDVVRLVVEGKTNTMIASELNIGVKTVETHRAAVMRKLNLASSAALVRYAIRNQIVDA
jgi:DNA-binding NarL/FixJ family response regulator